MISIKQDELANKMQQYVNGNNPAINVTNTLINSSANPIDNLKLNELSNLNLPKEFPDLQTTAPVSQYVSPKGFMSRISAIFASGKTLRERLRAVPLLGYGIACILALVRMPKTLQQQQVLNQVLLERLEKVKFLETYVHGNLHYIYGELHSQINQTQSAVDELEQQFAHRIQAYDYLEIGKRLMQIEQIESARKFKQISLLLQEIQKQIRQETTNLSVSTIAESSPPNKNGHTSLDQFFSDFETKFRGSRSEILQRLRVYLPYLENELKAPSGQRRHFVDVGCGRGEWLELMSTIDIPCLGVDLNTAKVQECVAQNLAAITADAITYLKQQEANSLGGVTGFHIIEHLPFPILIELFDAAFHALAPGGVLIFETPNPENLIVGSCNFYYDPTHLNPIVPDVAQFIAQQRGFSQAEIKRLHPFPDDYQMSGNTAIDQTLNKFLFSAQDYALIARK